MARKKSSFTAEEMRPQYAGVLEAVASLIPGTEPAKEKSLLDTPRYRFNSGYWDGVADSKRHRYKPLWKELGVRKHFDKVYTQGWEYGQRWHRNGQAVDGSQDAAWKEYQEDKRRKKHNPFG